MPFVIALVAKIPSVTGLPQDSVENVFHVLRDDVSVTSGDLDPLCEAVEHFYSDGAAPIGNALSTYFSESLSRATNACTVTAYATDDFSGATPFGSPFTSSSFTLEASLGGDPMPEEVAAVLSYAADLTDVPVSQTNPTPPPATIRPAQRRKGRVYLGPLNTIAGSVASNLFRPASGFRDDATLCFKRLAETINAEPQMFMGVWSKADEEVWIAESCYMDDAWDTQRRRGVEPTTRTVQTF